MSGTNVFVIDGLPMLLFSVLPLISSLLTARAFQHSFSMAPFRRDIDVTAFLAVGLQAQCALAPIFASVDLDGRCLGHDGGRKQRATDDRDDVRRQVASNAGWTGRSRTPSQAIDAGSLV